MAQLFRETYVCICIAVEKMMSGKGQTLSHHSRELLFLLLIVPHMTFSDAIHLSLNETQTPAPTHITY